MSQEELSFRAPGRKPTRPAVWSVSQVVRGANRLLEGKFSNIWIEGEITSLKIASSGHAFFTLQDPQAALPSAMWRSAVQGLGFDLQEGQKLRCLGRLGIFPKQGRFQFYIDRAEPAGLGARTLELEQRKKRLSAEGLFDPARKRPLVAWPRVVGVVTSASGAAVHDIIEVARRRCPTAIVLAPALVQGPEAPRSLIMALSRIAKVDGVDVVIIGRGGGSAEDLWCFNDENLVRAVAACPVPVVSAVGHEVDVSLCDLAADLRAATPSHAAELVVPDRDGVIDRLHGLKVRLERGLSRALLDQRSELDAAKARLARLGRGLTAPARTRLRSETASLQQQHPRQRLHRARRRLDALRARLAAAATLAPQRQRRRLLALDNRLYAAMQGAPRRDRLRLAGLAGGLTALSPLAVLQRGYAVVTDQTGTALVDAAAVEHGDTLDVRLHRGTLRVAVTQRQLAPDESGD